MDGELDIARQHVDVHEFRSTIPAGSLVVGRYSVLPFCEELGLELFIEGPVKVDDRAVGLYVEHPTWWHWIVMLDGKMIALDTTYHTLLPVHSSEDSNNAA